MRADQTCAVFVSSFDSSRRGLVGAVRLISATLVGLNRSDQMQFKNSTSFLELLAHLSLPATAASFQRGGDLQHLIQDQQQQQQQLHQLQQLQQLQLHQHQQSSRQHRHHNYSHNNNNHNHHQHHQRSQLDDESGRQQQRVKYEAAASDTRSQQLDQQLEADNQNRDKMKSFFIRDILSAGANSTNTSATSTTSTNTSTSTSIPSSTATATETTATTTSNGKLAKAEHAGAAEASRPPSGACSSISGRISAASCNDTNDDDDDDDDDELDDEADVDIEADDQEVAVLAGGNPGAAYQAADQFTWIRRQQQQQQQLKQEQLVVASNSAAGNNQLAGGGFQLNSPLDALFQMTSSTFDALKRGEKRKDRESTEHNNGASGFTQKHSTKKKRKSRTAFTNNQIYELERRFRTQKYLSPTDRDEIAMTLNLSNAQVITWFQNRRAKLKRDLEEQKRDIETAQILSMQKTFFDQLQATLTNVNVVNQLKTAISTNDAT